MSGVRDLFEAQTVAHGKRPFRDHFSTMRTQNGGAQNLAGFIGQDFDEPRGGVFRFGPIDFSKREPVDGEVRPLFAKVVLG